MEKSRPIGIFDSGVGGTSIWREIHRLLPLEKTIYLADSINAPYGEKPREKILDLSIKNTRKLLEYGAKIIVVACNTATTNAIQELRNSFEVPFIGIEPAIKPAISQSRNHTIGILATKGTLSSELFAKTSQLHSEGTKIVEVVGTHLVEAIENGDVHSKELEIQLRELLRPMLDAEIDFLVLGCSHYPYLIPLMKKILPPNIKIIDSGEAVANQTRAVLKKHNLLAESQQAAPEFYTNGNPEILSGLINSENEHFKVSFLEF